MVAEILTIIAPLFLIAALGYLWARLGKPFDSAMVTQLTVLVTTPALVIYTFMKSEISLAAFSTMVFASLLLYALVGIAAALFLLTGAEFLAMILLIVYVGAVAVLFLFVVMMLDVDFAELKAGALQYAPIGALVGIVLVAELAIVLGGYTLSPDVASSSAQPIRDLAERHNTAQLGDILYTDYVYAFQVAGIILLVAMIGAIVLTLRHKEGVKRQVIAEQVARDPRTAIEVRKVESGKGI